MGSVAAPRAAAPGAPSPAPVLSLKQQAARKKEEEERAERIAALKVKAKKRGASGGSSMRADARRAVEEAEKKLAEESQAYGEILKKQLAMDKVARKADDWVASVAGDKANGREILRFRDKHGEDGGCC